METIRLAERDDFDLILRLYCLKENDETFPSNLAINQRLYVLEVDDNVIGCASLTLLHNLANSALIDDIVITSELRGLGYGKKLIRRLIELAEEEGVSKVSVMCSDANAGFFEVSGMDQKDVVMSVYF